MKQFSRIIGIYALMLLLNNCTQSNAKVDIQTLDYDRIINSANKYLNEDPVTVTSFICERSMGGKNDFYSEGDYWWPNPDDPEGPYIRRDGNTNPDNFIAHRKAMRNLSVWVPSLVAAYKLTGNEKYADRALVHLVAWFINKETMMNPNLLFAQAIKGRVSGRGIGIIDTIHLIEVAKAIQTLKESGYLNDYNFNNLVAWFNEYTNWLTTSSYGIDERDHGNNHSAWWVAQVAAFSQLTGNKENLAFCRKFYKEVILSSQMDTLGRFTDELTRTKPYSYSLFNLEAFSLICELLSNKEDNLWNYSTSDGKSVKLALEFMYPFVKDKTKWPYPPDIAHFDELPVRGSALLFGGLAYKIKQYIELWKTLEPDPTDEELIRTFVIRQPLLWVN
jgi:hypothetical protein